MAAILLDTILPFLGLYHNKYGIDLKKGSPVCPPYAFRDEPVSRKKTILKFISSISLHTLSSVDCGREFDC